MFDDLPDAVSQRLNDDGGGCLSTLIQLDAADERRCAEVNANPHVSAARLGLGLTPPRARI